MTELVYTMMRYNNYHTYHTYHILTLSRLCPSLLLALVHLAQRVSAMMRLQKQVNAPVTSSTHRTVCPQVTRSAQYQNDIELPHGSRYYLTNVYFTHEIVREKPSAVNTPRISLTFRYIINCVVVIIM
jgi:hypothetical protein